MTFGQISAPYFQGFIIRHAKASLVCLCLLALCTIPAHAQSVGPKPVSSTATGAQRIAMPQTIFATPLDAASAFAKNFPESLEGKQKLAVSAEADANHEGQLLVTVIAKGLLDDSVEAEQWLIRLKPAEGGWMLTGMTMRSRCARGDNAGLWRVGSCL